MSNESIVNKIVKECSGPVSVFLGAGASMPIGLPDMVSFWENAYGSDFFENIDKPCPYLLSPRSKLAGEQISNNEKTILRRLIQTASIGKDNISCDLEELFDYIHSCPILSASLTNVEALKKSFYLYHTCCHSNPNTNTTYKTDFAGFKKEYAPYKSNVETWIDDVLGCINILRSKLYSSYLIDDNEQWLANVNKAAECYSFLPTLFPNYLHPVLFTTNYDTVFDALEISGKLKTLNFSLQNGTAHNSENRRYYFSLENYLKPNIENLSSLFLFRMHGSVAWERSGKRIEDHFPQKHDSQAEIVEPVISKKLPQKEPFRGMYDIFKDVLQTNKVLLSIGFSFRDDAIRAIVEDELARDRNFKVICVAPPCEKVPDLDQFMTKLEKDFCDRFIWMKEYFGTPETSEKIKESVKEILQQK